MTPSDRETLDYAVVGGGVAGIYSAWRLLDAKPGGSIPKVALFEMSDRLGGRLLTVDPPGIPNARLELGGMRFIEESHPWVAALVKHLKLDTTELPAGLPENIAYLRGRWLRIYELTNANSVPYALRGAERSPTFLDNPTAVTAVQALREAMQTVLGKTITKWQELTELTPQQWRQVAEQGKTDGAWLSDLPMRYMMLRAISHEAFDFAQDSSGYDSILYTWNAADGFSWNVADYGPNVHYLHVTDGYDKVPRRLAEDFEQMGGAVNLNTALKSFDAEPDDVVTLTVVDKDKQVRTVKARHLILAMPRHSLELLDQTGAVLGTRHDDVHQWIGSVTPIPLFKLGICYRRPWWEDLLPVDPGSGKLLRITSGKSVTDLPIRQCYYWKVNRKTNDAMILIYDDGVNLDYWAGLREAKEGVERYPHDPAILNDVAGTDWDKYWAPRRMVEEVHRQLLELHGNPPNVPLPYTAAYKDWGDDPFGGGANFWPVGVRSHEVSEKILQPKPPYRVYVCGDCYSHAQGWVEGALATAEEMLQSHLKLKRPAWKKPA